MIVYFSYMVSSKFGTEVEDEIHSTREFANGRVAITTLLEEGYERVDDRNFKKKINSTLYYIATLPKVA